MKSALTVLIGALLCAAPTLAQENCSFFPEQYRGGSSGQVAQLSLSNTTSRSFKIDWLPFYSGPGNCQGSEWAVSVTNRLMSPSQDRAAWGGAMDHCFHHDPFSRLVGALMVIVNAKPGESDRISLLNNTPLGDAIYHINEGVTSVVSKCAKLDPDDPDEVDPFIYDAYINANGAMTITPVFIWLRTAINGAAILIHETHHRAPRPEPHLGWLCKRQPSDPNFPLAVCDLKWRTDGTFSSYQGQILWMADFATRGTWVQRHRDREIANEIHPDDAWVVGFAKTSFGFVMEDVLESAFDEPPCITVETNADLPSWGKLDYSNCQMVNGEMVPLIIPEPDADEDADESKPEPEPEPEPEDPCQYDRNWRKAVDSSGECTAWVCHGLNETQYEGEKCGCIDEFNAYDDSGCDVVVCEWPDGLQEVIDRDCTDRDKDLDEDEDEDNDEDAAEDEADKDNGNGEREGTVTISEQYPCVWVDWSDADCSGQVCERAGKVDKEAPIKNLVCKMPGAG